MLMVELNFCEVPMNGFKRTNEIHDKTKQPTKKKLIN